ncbi:hypothetical protein CBS101457_006208 [Exobasidium rhododendri]|nr:hypothetical protein CBS101457_006208 [Exobasidium rhododendri]
MASRFISRLDQTTTALFVCDIQERFANAIYGFPHMIDASAKLIKGSTILQVPIFATEQNPKALGATVPALKQHFSPTSSVVYPKTKFSMVLPSGETDEFLRKYQIKNVMIIGIESHVCVLQTCLDLLSKNIGVYLILDAISSCNKEEVSTAVERMRLAGATVTTSESVLFELMVDSSHPNFKQISALIKEEKERTRAALVALTPVSKY